MAVHQLIPGFTPGDAMGAAAIGFQQLLRRLGHFGEVFAGEVADGFHSLVKPVERLSARPDDWVLYHHGIASPLAGKLMHLGCRRAVVFHNITPARFYAGTRLEEPLIAGRAQLSALADAVELSIGVSELNVRELKLAGHRNVHWVPLFIEPQRFDAEHVDLPMKRHVSRGGRPVVLSVARVVPHKRVEDLLSLHAEVLRIAPEARLLIVGGYAPGMPAFRALEERARALGRVEFLGKVNHFELVSCYRHADVYVSMSEHEGFGVPLIEAMAADVPVLAFGAAAVPETMGGRGIVFDEKHFAALAELVVRLRDDAELKHRILDGQHARLAELSPEVAQRALATALGAPPAGKKKKAKAPKKKAKAPKKKRVGIVVQRFGPNITGGAEAHARQVAERLVEHADVTVFTTCASDHLTWGNTLREGKERDGRLNVERFATEAERRMRKFNRLSDQVFGHGQDLVTEQHWLAEQGPRVPALLRRLVEVKERFDAFVFFTYLYAPTAHGVPLLADKALVVPTAHDEPPLAFDAFADVFERPRALICNTPEEVALIRRRFPHAARTRVVGVGVEAPKNLQPARFAERYGVRGPYLLYVGRLEAGKGIKALLKHHAALVKAFHDAPTLVLAGAGELKPSGDRVRAVGRISDEDKWDALAGALAAVVPSKFESLSLLALEAFACGTPVLGNAESTVLEGHVQRSGAGFVWHDAETFQTAVQRAGEQREALGEKARRYARSFTWNKVIDAYLEELEAIAT